MHDTEYNRALSKSAHCCDTRGPNKTFGGKGAVPMDQPLNQEIELTTRARTNMTGTYRAGMLALGNAGLEFITRAVQAKNFTWLPWAQIQYVWIETFFGGRLTRGFQVTTVDGDRWEFNVAHAQTVLAYMARHLSSRQILQDGRTWRPTKTAE
ncbi:DUF956 family protein [Schleiferilactobacillus harbinensis]|nr:DUF956 family protein [Schleiferilactobacillus harbinensis]